MTPAGSYRTNAYLQAAQTLGLDVVVASEGEHSVVPAYSRGIKVRFADIDQTLSLIFEEAQRSPFSGVVATDDYASEVAAQIAQRLDLPHNDPHAVRIARRKDLARQRLLQHGMRCPRFWRIDLNHSLADQIDAVTYPCVAKPIALSASRGVIRADTPQQLLKACDRIRSILREVENPEENHCILVEEFIPGSECAVEGLLHEGSLEILAIFDKPDDMQGPYFEETYYVTPSRMSQKTQEIIRVLLQKACIAYGLHQGPIHGECRVNERGVWVLELAARTIGGECARVFGYGTNVGLEQLVLANATGCRLPMTPKLDIAAGVLMIPVPKGGVLRRVEGVSAAQRVVNVEEVIITVREGYVLTPWPEGTSYLGFIFARAETPEHVETALRTAHAHLNIVVAPMFNVSVA